MADLRLPILDQRYLGQQLSILEEMGMGEDEFRRVWSFFFGDDCDVIEENDLYFSTNIYSPTCVQHWRYCFANAILPNLREGNERSPLDPREGGMILSYLTRHSRIFGDGSGGATNGLFVSIQSPFSIHGLCRGYTSITFPLILLISD